MRLLAATILLFIGTLAIAHPTSYKGATGIMSYNTPTTNELLLTYSLSHRFALATTYLRDSSSEFYIPRANFLLARWNEHDSQANIYLSGGSGWEKFNNKTYSAHLAELIADWESRKYYVYLEHQYLRRNNIDNNLLATQDYNHSKARFGIAPFLAEFDELNVWAILQFDKHLNNTQIEATPFLRFYIRNVLWEIGAGFNGSFNFNFMIHL
ncbi:MAG: hypothetical protein IPM57_08685 [Oligoflexia bacterium]|nr:hypothetical protein [Oligoflexia bacterium]